MKIIKKYISLILVAMILLTTENLELLQIKAEEVPNESESMTNMSTVDISNTEYKGEVIYSGTYGKNIWWEVDKETGTLTINGIGEFGNVIGWEADYGIQEVQIDGVTYEATDYDGPWVFSNVEIKKLVIGEGITAVDVGVLHTKKEISVELSDTVKTFSNTSSVIFNHIYIGKAFEEGLDKVQNQALEGVTISPDNYKYKDINGVVYSKSGKTIYLYPQARTGFYNIPENVKTISEYAFCGSKISGVDLGNGVKEIKCEVFAGCDNLTSIKIPDSVTKLGEKALYAENLKEIVVGKGLTKGLVGAINFDKPIQLKISEENSKYKMVSDVVYSKDEKTLYKYPKTKTKFKISEKVTKISDKAFYGCGFKTIKLPKSVTKIGAGAFSYNKQLKTINIPKKVTKIYKETFYGCKALKTIKLPSKLTDIDEAAFEGCKNINNITLPAKLKFIGKNAFSGCVKIKKMKLPKGLQKIETSAFVSTGLKNITIPKNTVIGKNIVNDSVKIAYQCKFRKIKPTQLGTIFWCEISGARGYEVSTIAKDYTGKVIGKKNFTTKKNRLTDKVRSAFAQYDPEGSNNIICYKIRAYQMVGKKKIYTKWSSLFPFVALENQA